MSMIEATKEQFFKVIGPMNVHPSPGRSYTEWASLNSRQIVGRSEPGYIPDHQKTDRYWLEEGFAKR